MDTENGLTLSSVIASFLVVARRTLHLIFTPYATMRRISLETDYSQIYIILFLVMSYFVVSGVEKIPVFLLNFSLTLIIFKVFGLTFNRNFRESTLAFPMVYTLIPTLIWFTATYVLYQFLPPPRTFSLLGRSFSIIYVCFSLSLLLWKILLVYLALRFSVKRGFYTLLYILMFYVIYLWNFSTIMYRLGLSKVPFI